MKTASTPNFSCMLVGEMIWYRGCTTGRIVGVLTTLPFSVSFPRRPSPSLAMISNMMSTCQS